MNKIWVVIYGRLFRETERLSRVFHRHWTWTQKRDITHRSSIALGNRQSRNTHAKQSQRMIVTAAAAAAVRTAQ